MDISVTTGSVNSGRMRCSRRSASSKSGKVSSRIRLTNWDALALAQLVGKGMPVDFVSENAAKNEEAARPTRRHH
jgi:hypothetical protein